MGRILCMDEFELSKHAEVRMNQRGVSHEVLGILLSNFDRSQDRGKGVQALGISGKQLKLIKNKLSSFQLIEVLKGLIVLINGSTIITVMHETNNTSKYLKRKGRVSLRGN